MGFIHLTRRLEMLGKGALLTIFGFILAFSSYQVRLSNNVLAASDNFNDQFVSTMIHQTTLSSMNLAVNKVWAQNVDSDTFMVLANHCSCRAEISQVGQDTVKVKVKSWGNIYDEEYDAIVTRSDSVTAFFSNNMPISKYFWFTDEEQGVYWITGDSVWGPVHTNGVINTSGSPVFFGKVTAHLGISPDPLSSSAHFYGGWEIGILNNIPTDMSYIINAANAGNGAAPMNTKCNYDTPVSFDFQADGSVIRTVQGNPPDTVLTSSIAPTEAIYSTADITVKGTFNGQLTIYSATNIWIDDDLVYADDPLSNPNSDDILGLVANNNIYVTENATNNNDIHIQACIMAKDGSFTAQNYDTRPVSGTLYMTGSIVQNKRGPVGTFSGGGIISGFYKRYRFDSRLSVQSPPNYPYIKSLSLVSWWE